MAMRFVFFPSEFIVRPSTSPEFVRDMSLKDVMSLKVSSRLWKQALITAPKACVVLGSIHKLQDLFRWSDAKEPVAKWYNLLQLGQYMIEILTNIQIICCWAFLVKSVSPRHDLDPFFRESAVGQYLPTHQTKLEMELSFLCIFSYFLCVRR